MAGLSYYIRRLAGCILVTIAVLVTGAPVSAQDEPYEEIVIGLEIPKLVHRDIIVQYDGRMIFLPLTEIFDMLDVNLEADFEERVFKGFLISRDNKYTLDLDKGQAKVGGQKYPLEPHRYILIPGELYLRLDAWRTLFGFDMTFDFSNLSVRIPLNKEFPSYQKLMREKARRRLHDEKIAISDVVEMGRTREKFKMGVADWIINASPVGGGGQNFSLNAGAMILDGDFSIYGSGNSSTGFDASQLRYQWHYYLDDNRYLTQTDLGNINLGGMLSRNLDGVRVTNQPQIRRRFFQTIDVSGYLGEGWEVELYVNDRLTDFAYTDRNGEYNFMADVYYGGSRVSLKMYGPNGEIREEEKYYSVPLDLVPGGTFEYTVAGGSSTRANKEEQVAQVQSRLGVTDFLTLGVSGEMLFGSDEEETSVMAAEASLHPFSNLLLSGGFSPGYQYTGAFSFSKPELLNFNGSYTSYDENPFRNPYEQLHKMRLSVSSPMKIFGHRVGLRYYLSSVKYAAVKTVNMTYGINTRIFGSNVNYSGNKKTTKRETGTENSFLSQWLVSVNLARWLRPQFRLNYDHDLKQMSKAGVYLARRIFRKGQLTISYERDFIVESNQIMFTFNIFTHFANFSTRAISSGGQKSITQTQRGSVRFDQENTSLRFVRDNGVGSGSAIIWPFLDENYNGKRDEDEQLLPELRARLNGVVGTKRKREEIYYYDGLVPYDDYLVQIDPISLDNPQLQPSHENYRVMINPNVITGIEVPIVTAGEVSGLIERVIPGAKVGVGSIKIIVINEKTGAEVQVTSFNNGEYFYLGLVPGMYRALLDKDQLDKYGYRAEPEFRTFQISTVEGGDFVEDMNFLLIPKKK